jgi:DNA-binding CsgD family transcriptional regulator
MELYRDTGSPAFSPRELALIRRVAPDVGVGLRVAALQARGETETPSDTTPGVLVIDRAGRVTATPAAERFLSDLGDPGHGWRAGHDLPIAIHVVLGALRQTLAPESDADLRLVPRLRVRARSGRWLSLHAAQSEDELGRPGEQTVVIAPAHPEEVAWLGVAAYALSPREEDVVKLVVGGLSTRQIADRLFIAEHTVQRHLSNIFEKVGVRSRRALVKQLFFEQVLPSAAVL